MKTTNQKKEAEQNLFYYGVLFVFTTHLDYENNYAPFIHT